MGTFIATAVSRTTLFLTARPRNVPQKRIIPLARIAQIFHLAIERFGRNGPTSGKKLKPCGLNCKFSHVDLYESEADASHKISLRSPSDISCVYAALFGIVIGFFSFSTRIFCAEIAFFVDVSVKACLKLRRWSGWVFALCFSRNVS